MPEKSSREEKISLLESLSTIARLHWTERHAKEIEPQISQTAKHLEQIIRDIPDSELEP